MDGTYQPSTGSRPVSSPVLPLVVVCVGAFAVATAFMAVFDAAIDTILLCFCEDQERNNGMDRPYYASSHLRQFLANSQKYGPSGAGGGGGAKAPVAPAPAAAPAKA
eukprot:tig00020892_g14930.t1